jgi:excisionase family DNA binding protein
MHTYDDEVFTPGMVAELFKVDAKTVSRWAHSGKLPSFKTPGGHHRFKKKDVDKFLDTERS